LSSQETDTHLRESFVPIPSGALPILRFSVSLVELSDLVKRKSFRNFSVPSGHFPAYRFRFVCRIERLAKRNSDPPSTQPGSARLPRSPRGGSRRSYHLAVLRAPTGPTHPVRLVADDVRHD
jgi:hypothetical protein